MVNRFGDARGLTLTELLIVVALIALVFTAAISMYTSALKFLGTRQAVDITATPDVAIEQVTRKTTLANAANLTEAGSSQLNIRLDQTCAGVALGTPSNTSDDNWWHFRLTGNRLLSFCNGIGGTSVIAVNNPVGTTMVLDNLDTNAGGSSFQMTNPSGVGSATVISFHIVSTNPAMTVDTETALGASPKR